MDELCTACHTSGRKLFFISETKFETLYSQIINEISVYNMPGLCIRICWECKALLRRMDEFKEQAKRCYTELVQYVEQNTTKPFPLYPRLQIHQIENFSYPLTIKEEEDDREYENNLVIDTVATDDEMPLNDEPFNNEPFNDGPFNGDEGFDVKTEEPHCEPETFVRNWKPEEVKRKKGSKKIKPIKQKSKKKQKIKNEKEVKRKIKKKNTGIKSSPTEKRTIESLIDSTVVNSYNQEADETKTEGEQKTVENEKQVEGNGDSGDNVNILVYTTPNFNMAKMAARRAKKPIVVKETLPDRPTCAECGKTFSSRKTYKYHLNVLHKGQNRHPCPRCGKVYQWKSNLGRHIRSHKARDSDELYCEKCDKRFASVATYRQHLRISRRHVSESEFSFTCSDCGKKFVNKTRLRDHIDWEHLKKIKFTCQKCNKAFKCHTSLYVHMQNVHCAKDQKLNLCHVCGKSYQNAAKLKYHIVAMHTSETPYQCTQCTAAFGWYSSLYRHVKEVHYKIKHQPKKAKKQKKSEVLPSLLPALPVQLMVQPVPPHT